MNIEEVPEEHWMLLDNDRKVLFHRKDIKAVIKESRTYPVDSISIERKYSGLIF